MTPLPSASPVARPDEALPRPASIAALFIAFSWLALQGFGGVVAVVQRELVENRRWLTREQFLEDWAVVQILPGPNVMNLALLLGDRYFGWRGAVAAMAGMLSLPLVIVLALVILYSHFAGSPAVAGALRGMAAAAAGLIVATGLKLAAALRGHPLGSPACAAFALMSFAGVALLRWPLFVVLVGLGFISCLLTWRRLAA